MCSVDEKRSDSFLRGPAIIIKKKSPNYSKSFLRADLEFESERASEHTKDRITSNSGNKICLHLACAHHSGGWPIVSVLPEVELLSWATGCMG